MKRLLIILLLLAAIAVIHWFLTRRPTGPQSVSGTIDTDEAHVASRYGGRVVALYAQEGDALTNGQAIVDLDAAELQARRDQVAATLLELENGPRTNEVAAVRHELESLKADLALAAIESKRAVELFEKKVAPVEERDRAVSHVEMIEARVHSAEARLNLLLEGTRPEMIANARARLAEIETQRREMRVVAPGNCVLEVLNVKVGDVLPANREVATLLLSGHLWVRVYVPETWLGLIQIGQKVNVRTDTPAGREFSGEVEQMNRQAEFTPRNVQTAGDRIRQVFGVKVRLPVDTDQLRPGMSVDVSFPNVPPPPSK